jgi:hypothetical protein
MRANERENLIYDQPKTLNDRLTIARDFVHRMEYDLEVVVDSMDNVANEAFAAWPERLYIVDTNGKVAYKGRMGPEGFVVDEVERWLDQNLDDAS